MNNYPRIVAIPLGSYDGALSTFHLDPNGNPPVSFDDLDAIGVYCEQEKKMFMVAYFVPKNEDSDASSQHIGVFFSLMMGVVAGVIGTFIV